MNVARTRWIEGLAAAHHGAVEEAAGALAEIGYRPHAADAWADADILAGRAGVPSDAGQRAADLCTEVGMHPRLEPLPETRWLRPGKMSTIGRDA